ncbi:MAG: hypothetical protein HY880_05745 [Deltaproteobacteria bacterium]|nr:hypothetical protein [Deltaproteobacteria bacterium]
MVWITPKTILVFVLSFLIVFNMTLPVFAEEQSEEQSIGQPVRQSAEQPVVPKSTISSMDEPSGTEMAFDIVFLRSFGLVSMVVGTGLFIVSLPFTVPTSTVGLAGRKFISEPAEYTFVRPVGKLDYP